MSIKQNTDLSLWLKNNTIQKFGLAKPSDKKIKEIRRSKRKQKKDKQEVLYRIIKKDMVSHNVKMHKKLKKPLLRSLVIEYCKLIIKNQGDIAVHDYTYDVNLVLEIIQNREKT